MNVPYFLPTQEITEEDLSTVEQLFTDSFFVLPTMLPLWTAALRAFKEGRYCSLLPPCCMQLWQYCVVALAIDMHCSVYMWGRVVCVCYVVICVQVPPFSRSDVTWFGTWTEEGVCLCQPLPPQGPYCRGQQNVCVCVCTRVRVCACT